MSIRAVGVLAVLLLTHACASGPPEVRLYVLDGGILQSDPADYLLSPDEVADSRLAVAAFLVAHPDGLLVWDAGAVPDGEWSPTGGPVEVRVDLPGDREAHIMVTETIGAQMARAGYAPSQVDYLALSHGHRSHVANAGLFSRARWLTPRAEWAAMLGSDGSGAEPASHAALRRLPTVLVDEEHDVFGDGRVVIRRAAGHTPGHQVLYVDLAETGGVVLSGDLYHYPEERALGRLPPFEGDPEQSRASRAWLEAFLSRTGATLWIQHDLGAHRARLTPPAFYR